MKCNYPLIPSLNDLGRKAFIANHIRVLSLKIHILTQTAMLEISQLGMEVLSTIIDFALTLKGIATHVTLSIRLL